MPYGVGGMGEVKGVDADTMATDQAGPEFEKIPLGASSLHHFSCIDPEPIKN